MISAINSTMIYFLDLSGAIISARISIIKAGIISDPFIPPSNIHITEMPMNEILINGIRKGLYIFFILTTQYVISSNRNNINAVIIVINELDIIILTSVPRRLEIMPRTIVDRKRRFSSERLSSLSITKSICLFIFFNSMLLTESKLQVYPLKTR